MIPDVYLCYSPADGKVAEKLCAFLESQGIRCWIAPRNMRLGETPGEAALSGIQDCAVVVLVFSQSANESPEVQRDAAFAVRADKVLIPFRIENVPAVGALEAHLRRRYWHEAHTLPLDKHLEELSRMLRPLTRQRQTPVPDDDSLLRTLPSRSSILRRSDAPGEAASGESAGPLRVSFNFHQVAATGRASVCACRVENRGLKKIGKIEILLESRGLKRAASRTLAGLEAGATERASLGLEPLRSGNLALHATVTWIDGATRFASIGSISLPVGGAPTNAELMRRTQALAARSEESLSPGELSLGEDLPGDFEPVELRLDHQVRVENLEAAHRLGPLEIPSALLNQAQAGKVLKLEPSDGATGEPFQGIRLVARDSFGLGRSQEECDFFLWFWPRNEVHDTKTRRISKKHCTLAVEKGKRYVRNTAAASLTTFDGQDLAGAEGVVLEQRGLLNLSGIYVLEITPLASTCPSGPVISNLRAWKDAATAPGPRSGAGGGVRFVPLTPNVLRQNAAWLLTDGTFGTSRINLIVLEAPGLADLQGRFHYHLGHFWIENLVDNGAVRIDDAVLPPGFIAPLAGGQTLHLGEQRLYLSVIG